MNKSLLFFSFLVMFSSCSSKVEYVDADIKETYSILGITIYNNSNSDYMNSSIKIIDTESDEYVKDSIVIPSRQQVFIPYLALENPKFKQSFYPLRAKIRTFSFICDLQNKVSANYLCVYEDFTKERIITPTFDDIKTLKVNEKIFSELDSMNEDQLFKAAGHYFSNREDEFAYIIYGFLHKKYPLYKSEEITAYVDALKKSLKQ